MTYHRLRLSAVLGAVVIAATACSGGESDSGEIVATTTIVGDLVTKIAGSCNESVRTILAPGQDPHSFQPSAADAAVIRSARLVFAVGLGLEAGLRPLLDTARSDGVTVQAIGPTVDPIPLSDGPGLDPHVWMDPRRMAEAATIVGEQLALVDPGSASCFTAAATGYRKELLSLDEEVETMLAPIESRVLVSNHDSLGYFAERYGFSVLGAVVPGGSTLAEPSARGVAELAGAMRAAGVRVVFTETTAPDSLARALAEEIGNDVSVVPLYTGSLGPPGSDAPTYVEMMRVSARRIADALGT